MSKHFDRVNNRTRAIQVSNYPDNRPVVYQMQEPMPMDNGGGDAQGYDSLLGYWHILVRNKVTLLCFALAGLAVADSVQPRADADVPRAHVDGDSGLQLGLHGFEGQSTRRSRIRTRPPIRISRRRSRFCRATRCSSASSNKMNTEEERPESGWGAFSAKMQHMLGLGDHTGDTEQRCLHGEGAPNLTVRATGKTRLVEVMYDSEDPKFAAQFANTLVSEFVEQSQEMRWKASQRTGEGLEAHLNEMKANLEKSEGEPPGICALFRLDDDGERKHHGRPTEGTSGRIGQGAGRSRR